MLTDTTTRVPACVSRDTFQVVSAACLQAHLAKVKVAPWPSSRGHRDLVWRWPWHVFEGQSSELAATHCGHVSQYGQHDDDDVTVTSQHGGGGDGAEPYSYV